MIRPPMRTFPDRPLLIQRAMTSDASPATSSTTSTSNAPSRPRATGRVTLADVARLAEVSPITVSRALRGERAVHPDLVARVKSAAQRLGYVPDPAPRALASRHSAHVAV